MDTKQAIRFLVDKAAKGGDAALYADLVLDNVGEGVLRQILAGDFIASLSAVDPRVAQHAEWFRDLGAQLTEALAADAAGPGQDTPGDGKIGGDT